MRTKEKSILAAISIFVLLSSTSAAFATHQPYIGGRPDLGSTIYYAASVFGYADHVGLKPSTYPIQNVLSTTGAVSSSATDPDAWIYQSMVSTLADTSGSMQADVEVRNCTVNPCNLSWDRETPHGNYQDTSYVYQTFIWQGSPGSRTGINFYHEWHYTNGNIQTYTESYTKRDNSGNPNGDPSQYFMAGSKTVTIQGTTYYVKFLQFGVESTGGQASGWKQRQYTMGFTSTAGVKYLKDFAAYSMQGGLVSDPGSSHISYYLLGPWAARVGDADYTANANYALRSSPGCGDSVKPPAGEVKWCKDPTKLPANTRLW